MSVGSVAASGLGQQLATLQGQGAAGQLTPQQQQEVRRLKAIDQKVRQHEQAHQSAGAGLAGAASFQYVRGPDGRQYAVAGEVRIDASPGATPAATLERARRIRAAALAPADPSAQDRAVAAAAALMESQARAELARLRREAAGGNASGTGAIQGGVPAEGESVVPAKEKGTDRRAVALGAYQAESAAPGQANSVDVFA